MKNLFKRVATVATAIAICTISAFASENVTLAENASLFIIVDSHTGNIVQDAKTVNMALNLIEAGENNGRYRLEPATEQTTNQVSNEAILAIEDSTTGDVIQNVENNNYIINLTMKGDSKYRLRPSETHTSRNKYDRRDNEPNRRPENGRNRTSDNDRNYTPEISIPVPETNVEKPSLDPKVYGLTGNAESSGNYISWNVNIGDRFGYRLYRNEGYGFVSVSDFPIKENYYFDEKATNNSISYSYRVAMIITPASQNTREEIGPLSDEIYLDRTVLMVKETVISIPIGSTTMQIDGQHTEIDPGRNTRAAIIDDRTFLPCRALVEALGGKIYWDQAESKVTVNLDGNTLILYIGRKEVYVNNSTVHLDVTPLLQNSRTMLPLRAFENLGVDIQWDGKTNTAYVSYPKKQGKIIR